MLRPQILPSPKRLGTCISSSAGLLQRSLNNVAPILPILARRAYSDLEPPSTDTNSLPTAGNGTKAPRPQRVPSQPGFMIRRFPREEKIPGLVPPSHRVQLRDACPCHQCVDPDSGQKSFTTTQLSLDTQVQSSKLNDDGSLSVVWSMDGVSSGTHESVYSAEMLVKFNSTMGPGRISRILWDNTILRAELDNCRISYDDWMAGGDKFRNAFAFLHKTGLIFVHGVPELETSVEEIGQQIGRLQDTFYDRTWDVVSKPKAENVAYTSQFLGLHQDLLYNRPTPRIQILHCLANDSEGGESLFSDGVRAAIQLKLQSPSEYKTLVKSLVAFHYDKNEHYYRDVHSTIKEDNGYVSSVWWSPPFQAPFHSSFDLQTWVKAARLFQSAIESPENMYQYKMKPGECVVFDNQRVLHGRRQFTTGGGKRWLKGTYVSDQVFTGKTWRLRKELGAHWTRSWNGEEAIFERRLLMAQLNIPAKQNPPVVTKTP